MRPIFDLVVFGAVLLVELLVRCLPPRTAMGLADGAGRLWYRLDARRRERARESLAVARRGGLDTGPVEPIVRATFANLMRVPFEAFLFPRFFRTPRRMKSRIRCLGDWAALRDDLQAGRGGLLVSGHLGNWEVGAWTLRFHDGVARVVARPIENRWVQRRALAVRGGEIGVIPKAGAVRAVARTLQQGGWVGFMGDQNAGRHGVFVPFFGLEASTFPAPAVLATRLGVPLYAAACLRRPGRTFSFEMHVRRLPDPPAHAGEGDVVGARLLALHESLEAWIRHAPDQYNWIHRRWRTRPVGESPGARLPAYADVRAAPAP